VDISINGEKFGFKPNDIVISNIKKSAVSVRVDSKQKKTHTFYAADNGLTCIRMVDFKQVSSDNNLSTSSDF